MTIQEMQNLIALQAKEVARLTAELDLYIRAYEDSDFANERLLDRLEAVQLLSGGEFKLQQSRKRAVRSLQRLAKEMQE